MSKKSKRKWEFKKWLAFWCMLLIMGTVIASFYLSYTDHQTVSDVTTTIITACVAYLVSYAAASTTEKVSRNRHGLDADGIPYNTNNNETDSTTVESTLNDGGVG